MSGPGGGDDEGQGQGKGEGMPGPATGPAPAVSRRRWLDGEADPAARALRTALDEARPSDDEQAFRRQRVWARVQAPWFDGRGGQPVAVELGMVRRRAWLGPLLGVGLAAAAITVVALGDRAGTWRSPLSALWTSPSAPAGRSIATAPVEPGRSGQPEIAPVPGRATGALSTGPGERIRHRLARGVDAELSARTALVPGDEQAPPEVRVGRVRFSVPEQAPGRRYAVRAGSYQVVVVGTVFDVAVDEHGVSVDVQSGTVEVHDASSGQRLARLAARMRWTSGEGPVTGTAAARAQVPATRGPARPRPPRRLTSAVADPGQARSLDQAGETRRRGDPRRALAMYQRMAGGAGPMAEIAHYEVGVIEDEDLGEPRRAVATWERYRVRYPRGLLRAEADLSVIEALARIGERQRALDEAVAFLRRHPGSERRAEIARVAGDLARQGGDCRGAVPLYEQALAARPAREDADDATFHRAACLIGIADARGLPAARAYLARFPLGRHALEAQRLVSGGARGGPAAAPAR